VFDAICDIKPRLFGLGRVANPRDTTRYRCGLRLAQTKNPSALLVASSIKHYTRHAAELVAARDMSREAAIAAAVEHQRYCQEAERDPTGTIATLEEAQRIQPSREISEKQIKAIAEELMETSP